MYLQALMAFLHHIAAFTVVGTLVAQVVLFKPPLSDEQTRRLRRTDMLFGISAGVLAVVGLLRVFFFEKGAGYYFTDAFFLAKLVSFIAAGLISIYPTRMFLLPSLSPEQVKRVRMCLMWELTAILVILFCAPFMARGFGYFGGH